MLPDTADSIFCDSDDVSLAEGGVLFDDDGDDVGVVEAEAMLRLVGWN